MPDDASTSTTPEPGWYPDPYGRFRHRWWDGSEWSAQAADSVVHWDPVSTEPTTSDHGPPGLVTALIGFGVGFAGAVALGAALEDAGDPGGQAVTILASSAALWLGLLGAVIVASRRRGRGSVVQDFQLRFAWRDIGIGFGGALAARLIAIFAAAPIPIPTERIGEFEEQVFEGTLDNGWTLAAILFVTCIGAPLFEELFFRGLLQGHLIGRFGVAWGIGITSVLFGLAHYGAYAGPLVWMQMWAIAVGGVALGLMRHYSGRLGLPIVAHFFFNAQAMAVLIWLS